jgi:hypothetical protein
VGALRIAEVIDRPLPVKRTVECIGECLVLINVYRDAPYSPAHVVHWLLGDGHKPPLDVAIDARSGAFLELTFFVWHEVVPWLPVPLPLTAARQGQVWFDVSLWRELPDDDRYADEQGDAHLSFAAADMVLNFGGALDRGLSEVFEGTVVGGPQLHFLVVPDRTLVGMILPRADADIAPVLRRARLL